MSCYLIKVENGHKVAAPSPRKRSISSCVEAMSRRRIFVWLVPETMLRNGDWCSLIIPAIIRKAW